VVQNGEYNGDNTDLGRSDVSVFWDTVGYEFSGLTYEQSFTTQACPPPPKPCALTYTDTFDVTVSGYVCGNPYGDAWTMNSELKHTEVDNGQGKTVVNSGPWDASVPFDPSSEQATLSADAQTLFLVILDPAYLSVYLHGMVDAGSGGKTPNQIEVKLNGVASRTQSGTNGVTFEFTFTGTQQTVTAPVTVKTDCP
jgi:hypothetical protein